MKKILMLLSHNPQGDIRVEKQISALRENGHDVFRFYSDNKKFPKPIRFIAWQLKIRNACRGFDVVHCHDLDTVLLGILIKRDTGCKLIFDSHEFYLWMLRWPERILWPYFWLVQKIAQRYVDVLIVISSEMKEYFEERYKFKEIWIVRNTQ